MDVLDSCREDYAELGDPQSLMRALFYCHERSEPPPVWLVAEIIGLLDPLRHKRPGQGVRSPAEAEAQAVIDVQRGMRVWRLRKAGMPAREVYQAAADDLAGTDWEGSEEAVRQSWRRVKATLPPV